MIHYHETKRLILRPLDVTEGQLALDYYKDNRSFLAAFEPTRDDNFYTLKHQNRLLAVEAEEMASLNMVRLWIFLKEGNLNRPIGNFAFTNILRGVFLSCFLGYKLDGVHIRKGYMTEALEKGIEIIFKDYGLHRIEANIMPKNLASMALARKLGFYDEGLAKKYLRINNVWEDHVHMVKFNEALE